MDVGKTDPQDSVTTASALPPGPLDTGLSTRDAEARLARGGRNAIAETHVSPVRKLLGYFWGPIPWMIEVAALLSAILRHWSEFAIIIALLLFNAGVGFWQEFKASNALDALRKSLALRARVLRDGRWSEMAADALVPGDVIRIRLGDIVPADVRLADGDYLSVDQAALTGESLPVSRKVGDTAYSGSIARQGEMVAIVTATGADTFFGKTAALVAEASTPSHFQRAVMTIGDYLIAISVVLAAALVLVQLFRGAPALELVQFALILTVAAIPVAMPAVLSMTMAVGAMALAREKAIVSRLQSIEEMAGIDILCSDKTGTLTQNSLTLGPAALFGARDAGEVILMAALASKAEDGDAIDLAVIAGLSDPAAVGAYRQTNFVPFDPVRKRTEAQLTAPDGTTLHVSKGAPQVIFDLANVSGATLAAAQGVVDEFAAKGYRTLGVARSTDGTHWSFLGLLPLFDPPRADSAETIRNAEAHGVDVKMVTGDDVAIAREVSQSLGLGGNIRPAAAIFGNDGSDLTGDVAREVERADGFARVFPQHKYEIVKALQAKGHIVGMTGDGVNDAPAIKQADVGIAVSGATDAARAAADLVLTKPGLSTIINAIEESRRIFERMNSYAIYRINETIRTMIFVVLAMIVFGFYPITAVMIILLAFFNDVPIMAIAYDNTRVAAKPVRWDMHRVLVVSSTMGIVGTIGSFGMLYFARDVLHLTIDQIQTYVFLKLAVAGHLALFVSRSRSWFIAPPWPSAAVLWSAIVTKVLATLLVVYPMGLMTPISWTDVAIVWGYSIGFAFVTDAAKVFVSRMVDHETARHHQFFSLLNRRPT
ncbi:plasma-membrane proton-efflux P-type ATPase [Acuticoccus sp. M5D2P5]|uniref:plasma-membrane proton-efflux P-type ATPase n=1 Tax=Acuticoccus kalidii TaxID=2910977 RepID=UPI001F157B83|nr:plasma-membrane proton-efflux P-type ATPase [Acuticoccus kalidii]MCF3935834.1 plasma-membrane proton-efflux P-type ATPase [Acuticoccus kalidii]